MLVPEKGLCTTRRWGPSVFEFVLDWNTQQNKKENDLPFSFYL